MKNLMYALTGFMLLLCTSCYTGRSDPSPAYSPKFYYFNQFATDWRSPDGNLNFNVSLNIADLSATQVNTNGILVDISFDNGGTYQQLPLIRGQVYYSCEYSIATIKINARNYITGGIIENPGVTRVKVIVLPAG